MEQTITHKQTDIDHGYDNYVSRMSARVEKITAPLFTTDAADLFGLYLSNLPTTDRQHYTCNTCRHFFERFGGLVTIGDDGKLESVMWQPNDAPGFYENATAALKFVVERAKVTGVYLSKDRVYGTPVTGGMPKDGGYGEGFTPRWTHYAVKVDPKRIYKARAKDTGEAMAETREEFKMLSRALSEFTVEHIETAVTLLRAAGLVNAVAVLGRAEWLLELKRLVNKKKSHQANHIWTAVATAPAGFAHVRSSMLGTLLDDIKNGADLEVLKRSFAAKMAPTAYQRPQAAPTLGTIKQAEELVRKLGIESALERRFARFDEVAAHMLWQPKDVHTENAGGVFGHLKPAKAKAAPQATRGVEKITWASFVKKVLPLAHEMHVLAPQKGCYVALVTATHDDAAPILKWDSEELRNPVSWYLYDGGSTATQWELVAGTYVKVTGVCDLPCHWNGRQTPGLPEDKLFLLDGARDRNVDGLALFMQVVRSDLHGVRAVIEAHSNSGKKTGREDASACGINALNTVVRVTLAGGVVSDYHIDRME